MIVRRRFAFLAIVTLCASVLFTPTSELNRRLSAAQAQGQGRDQAGGPGRGKSVRSYRKGQNGARPKWVDAARGRAVAHLKQQKVGWGLGLQDPDAELEVAGADEDDLGQTHVRMDQVFRGVPVFGGQLIVQLDAASARGAFGRVYKEARQLDTTPRLRPAEAVAKAVEALGYPGQFARTPEAKLVILPHGVTGSNVPPGASLTYQVELLIEDGTDRTARHQYFIDAHDGHVVWHFDNLMRQVPPPCFNASAGVGNSQYSGQQTIITSFANSRYYLSDPTRGCMFVTDMGNGTSGLGAAFTDFDNVWGNFNNTNRQTAGVDAHFGSEKTWDYFLNNYGRSGIDGSGYRMHSRVHYGQCNSFFSFNAFWDGVRVTYGSGDCVRPFTAQDIVGHEITHGLTERTSNLIYSGESGGANESFSDIFGTAVEFYIGVNPDYEIGEEIGGIRSMPNPPADGASIDHYSNYFNGIDVHYSSGIQNKAFYLLAEGGTHPLSRVQVTGIGRGAAEAIFYRALVFKLFPSATFYNVREATVSAAADLYGYGSAQYNATARAWDAVGVLANPIDDSRTFVRQLYLDFFNREPDAGGWNAWTDYINGCGNDPQCRVDRRIVTARGFMESGEHRSRVGGAFNPAFPGPGDTAYNREYVRQCYIVFLRRTPGGGEEQGWLNYLFSTGDYTTTVYGFVYSHEYRARFGPV
jgi:thermolysin